MVYTVKSTAPTLPRLFLLGMSVVILMITGCKSKDIQQEWGTYQEPVAPDAMPADSGVSELGVEWRSNAGKGSVDGFALLKPALSKQGLVVANRQGAVSLFDPDTGKRIWRNQLGKAIFAGVAAADNLVVVGLDNGTVVSLDADSGEVEWQVALNRQISSIAAIGRARVVVRTSDGQIIGLRGDNGERTWALERSVPQLSMHGDSTPVITGDAVLVGLPNGRLIANNVVTGREYWETELGFSRGTNEIERMSDADSAPIVSGNQIYTAAYQGNVVSLKLNDASVRWKTPLSTRLELSLLSDQLFVTDDLGGVVALSAENGEKIWEQNGLKGRGLSHPLAIGERVIVGDANGNVHSIDAKTGTLIETLGVANGAIRSILKYDNQLIIYTVEGELASLSIRKRLDL